MQGSWAAALAAAGAFAVGAMLLASRAPDDVASGRAAGPDARDPQPAAHGVALRGLGGRAPQPPESAAVELLRELRDGRRNVALAAFATLRDPGIVDGLFALLADAAAPKAAARAALKALTTLPEVDRDDVARRLARRLVRDPRADDDVLAALARLGGPEAVRVLADYLVHVPAPERVPRHVLTTLARRREVAAFDALAAALGQAATRQALEALLALGAAPGATELTAPLVALLRGARGAAVRGPVLDALGVIGGDEAVATLLARSTVADAEGRLAARAVGLVRWGEERTRASLEAALAGSDGVPHAEELQRGLLCALGALGDAQSLRPIAARLGSTSLEVQREAVRALGRLGPAAASEVPALVDLLDTAPPVLRPSVVAALGRIGGSEARSALERLAATEGLKPALRDALRRSLAASR
jgi:hypothetical protein